MTTKGGGMRKMIISSAIVVALAAGAWAVVKWGTGPTGQASGAAPAVAKALWSTLEQHQGNYLPAWSDQIQEKPADPMEALTAFNELAYSVTGPGGLWRKTVPDKYFGCGENEDLPICAGFRKVQPELAKWDKFQDAINDIGDDRAAWAFLKKHSTEIDEYVRTFVPADESFTAVQATPFFEKHLAAALPK